jgi:rRNA maturation RNase YbeY
MPQVSGKKTDVTYRTKGRRTRLPFDLLKDAILGQSYDLSVAFVGETEMARLNKAHRNKEGATDILSFTLDNNSGEIIICEKKARAKAPAFEETPTTYLKRLLIHGMLHLKGYDHGSTMEAYERRIRTRFSI